MDGFWFSMGSDWVHIWFIWLWREFLWLSLGSVVRGLSLPGSALAQLWCSWFRFGSVGWPEFIWFRVGSDFRGQSLYGLALVLIGSAWWI